MSNGELVTVLAAAALALAFLAARDAERAGSILSTSARLLTGVAVLALRAATLPPSPLLTIGAVVTAAIASAITYAIATLARGTRPPAASRLAPRLTALVGLGAAGTLAAGLVVTWATSAAVAEPAAAWRAIATGATEPVSVVPVSPSSPAVDRALVGVDAGVLRRCDALAVRGQCVLVVDRRQCLVVPADSNPTWVVDDADPHYACPELAVERVRGAPSLLAFRRGDAVRFVEGDHLGPPLTRAALRLPPPAPWLWLAAVGGLVAAVQLVRSRRRSRADESAVLARHARLVLVATALPVLLALLARLVAGT